jgi:hypothetical protein
VILGSVQSPVITIILGKLFDLNDVPRRARAENARMAASALVIVFWLYSFLAPASFAISNLVDNHVLHAHIRDPVSHDVLTIWPSTPIVALIFLATRVSLGFDAAIV